MSATLEMLAVSDDHEVRARDADIDTTKAIRCAICAWLRERGMLGWFIVDDIEHCMPEGIEAPWWYVRRCLMTSPRYFLMRSDYVRRATDDGNPRTYTRICLHPHLGGNPSIGI